MGKAFQKSEEEMEAEKMSMFAELKRICPDSSMWTNSKISMASSYEVINMELTIQKQNIDEDQKVFIARLILGAACRGIEWGSNFIYKKVNGKFLKLEGWAASIMADTAQFDPILRRCYRKLFPQGMGKADPFVELAIALAISAVTYGLLNRVMGGGQGAASTAVPSNANSFMDRNTPTPAQARAQAPQGPKGGGGGGGFMDSIMGALGGGEGNPLGAIFGMMQNGGLQSFMQGVQNHGTNGKEPPSDPFEAMSAPIDDMDPVEGMRRDAQRARHTQEGRPPPRPPTNGYSRPVKRRAPLPPALGESQRHAPPPSPPFNEATGRFENPKRTRTQLRTEQLEMEAPDEDEIADRDSVYETSSNVTMDCDSSSEGDMGQID